MNYDLRFAIFAKRDMQSGGANVPASRSKLRALLRALTNHKSQIANHKFVPFALLAPSTHYVPFGPSTL